MRWVLLMPSQCLTKSTPSEIPIVVDQNSVTTESSVNVDPISSTYSCHVLMDLAIEESTVLIVGGQ